MSRIDADEAAATLELLQQLGEAQAELESMRAANGETAPVEREQRT